MLGASLTSPFLSSSKTLTNTKGSEAQDRYVYTQEEHSQKESKNTHGSTDLLWTRGGIMQGGRPVRYRLLSEY